MRELLFSLLFLVTGVCSVRAAPVDVYVDFTQPTRSGLWTWSVYLTTEPGIALADLELVSLKEAGFEFNGALATLAVSFSQYEPNVFSDEFSLENFESAGDGALVTPGTGVALLGYFFTHVDPSGETGPVPPQIQARDADPFFIGGGSFLVSGAPLPAASVAIHQGPPPHYSTPEAPGLAPIAAGLLALAARRRVSRLSP